MCLMKKVTQRRKALHKFRIVFIARYLQACNIKDPIQNIEWTSPQAGRWRRPWLHNVAY
ncbi:hypothetical protein BDA96_10G311100 [Sorghum bicolor]|uniref:Uncharacterized protein n=1 Tax=Sorghum bicolor TaxID=4558 RepID=A0A921U2S0_SORBI|nr:hypothetical protein BDA96_10G311100 [Sorghum bicolor]